MKNKLGVIIGVFAILLTSFFVSRQADAADFGAISGTIVWDSETPLYQGVGFRIRFVGTNTGTNVLTFSNNCSSTTCIYNSDFTLPADSLHG